VAKALSRKVKLAALRRGWQQLVDSKAPSQTGEWKRTPPMAKSLMEMVQAGKTLRTGWASLIPREIGSLCLSGET
jgi:hypothetical protein